ncbi:hypothetical protein O3P69_017438 [Scylla paramamosain]|uniref:Endonuclease/exonuclease/phosphatase domain-containing protein n=1 Tax=Scylla paramamosain TaxID=85552 RepID=A0AAW0TVI6_SCYPA
MSVMEGRLLELRGRGLELRGMGLELRGRGLRRLELRERGLELKGRGLEPRGSGCNCLKLGISRKKTGVTKCLESLTDFDCSQVRTFCVSLGITAPVLCEEEAALAPSKPAQVDHDWVNHVSFSQEAQAWWTSSKPLPLHYPIYVPALSTGQLSTSQRGPDSPARTNLNSMPVTHPVKILTSPLLLPPRDKSNSFTGSRASRGKPTPFSFRLSAVFLSLPLFTSKFQPHSCTANDQYSQHHQYSATRHLHCPISSQRANWEGFWETLRQIPWHGVLTGDVNTQVGCFNSTNLSLQRKYIPSHTYTVKQLDQLWFEYDCRVAANNKSKTWKRYRCHLTLANKQQHKAACDNMRRVQ